MTARDRAAAVAEKVIGDHRAVLDLNVLPGKVVGCSCTHGDLVFDHGTHAAAALADALVTEGLIGDGETRVEVEWGVRGGPSGRGIGIHSSCLDPGGLHRRYDEALARYDTGGRPEDLMKRTVSRTVGAWEVVDDA